MSKKIVSIHGRPITSEQRVSPAAYVHGLRALWVIGAISQDSYFLAAQVAAKCQIHDVREVNLTKQEATTTCVRQGGTGPVITGPVSADHLAFVGALQQLHFKCGTLSHINPQLLDEEDAQERHFTLNPINQYPWSDTTPLYFRLPPVLNNIFDAQVSAMFAPAQNLNALALDLRG